MALNRFSGQFNASSYAYGVNPNVQALVVDNPNATVAGAATLTLQYGGVTTSDGFPFAPLNTNAPITVGYASVSNQETVTPSAVNNPTPNIYDSATVTATFSNAHGKGERVASGSVGLQEALNACAAYGGGTVIIDAGWVTLGGTQAMVNAATVPTGVQIVDNRQGGAASSGTLTARYSFAVDGGAIGLITPAGTVTLPKNFVITNAVINSPTAVTSAGSATISVGLSAGGGGAAALLAATAKTSFTANALIQGIPTAGTLTSAIKMSAAGVVTLTVAVAALTAGVIDVVLQGYQSPN
jgi:hypothetical protein